MRSVTLIDADGWPVCFLAGRPFTNVIRAVVLTNIRRTFLAWKSVRALPPNASLTGGSAVTENYYG